MFVAENIVSAFNLSTLWNTILNDFRFILTGKELHSVQTTSISKFELRILDKLKYEP